MAQFAIPKHRDAYAVVRGFRYQIDWTLIRWSELSESDHLELECGEDIDIVCTALEIGTPDSCRILEQIKLRERSITLRSPEARTSIANFALHRRNNPHHFLRFRYCTNARVGLERHSSLTGGRSGISVWNALSQATVESLKCSRDVAPLRALLRGGERPADCSLEAWNVLQSILQPEDIEPFCALLVNFEWSVAQSEAESLSERAIGSLVDLRLCSNIAAANDLYPRLFLQVMRVLGQPGRKVLSFPQLREAVDRGPLNEADKRSIRFLTTELFRVEERLLALEGQVIDNSLAIEETRARMEHLAAGASQATLASSASLLLPTTPPPVPPGTLPRRKLLDHLEATLAKTFWLALRGTSGSGKTLTARLLASRCNTETVWLSLRDQNEPQSKQQVGSLLAMLSGAGTPTNQATMIAAAVGSLPRNSLIVLDDIPRLSPGCLLAGLLCELADACRAANIYLLTTSHFDVAEVLPQAPVIGSVLVPSLEIGDIVEMLTNFGANPSQRNEKTARSIHDATAGHPLLSVAAVKRLTNPSVCASRPTHEETRSGTDMEALVHATLVRLIETTDEPATRQLLYRLSLVIGHFDQRVCDAVASVHPRIDRIKERFLMVDGIWIDRHGSDTYAVTPLVRPVADTEIENGPKTKVLLGLAAEVASRTKLSVIDAEHVITYFLRGNSPQEAAVFAYFALLHSQSLPDDEVRYLLDVSWVQEEMPRAVDLTLQLCIRTQQILCLHRIRGSIDQTLEMTTPLLEKGDKSVAWAKAAFVVRTSAIVARQNFVVACQHITLANSLRETIADQLPKIGHTVGRAIWMIATSIDSPQNLLAWLRCVRAMSPEVRLDAFAWEMAAAGCGVAINRPWMAMHLQQPPRRIWLQLLRIYRIAAKLAQQLHLEKLWSRAIVAQIIVTADQLDDLRAAKAIALDALASKPLSKSSQFLIEDALARQWLYKGDENEAISMLEAALAIESDEHPEIRSRTHLELSSAIGNLDPQAGIAHAIQSVAIAYSEPDRVGEDSLIVSLGELAIAYWLADDLVGAFVAFDEAFDRLLEAGEGAMDKRNLVPRLGHAISYCSTLAATGQPPDEESFSARPSRRLIMGWNLAMIEHYEVREMDTHIDAIISSLATLAVCVDKPDRALYWAERGAEEARRLGHISEFGLVGHVFFATLLRKGEIDEALTVVRDVTRADWAGYVLRSNKTSTRMARASAAVLGMAPNELWDGAEKWELQQGILPVLLYASGLIIDGHESVDRFKTSLFTHLLNAADCCWRKDDWHAALHFARACFERDRDWQKLKQEAEVWGDNLGNGMRYIGYLATSLQRETPLTEVAILHARIMAYLHKHTGYFSGVNEWVTAPFFTAFWQASLKSMPNCGNHLAGIEEASRCSCPDRLRRTAKTAIIATGARLPKSQKETRSWMQGSL